MNQTINPPLDSKKKESKKDDENEKNRSPSIRLNPEKLKQQKSNKKKCC